LGEIASPRFVSRPRLHFDTVSGPL